MPAAPIPEDESSRLESLHRLRALDSRREDAFYDLTELAARMLDAPIAAISLVDAEREWYMGCVGTDLRQLERRQTFCSYTILSDGPLLVADAAADPRFADNPHVLSGDVRSYAGVPIFSIDGRRLGAFCIKDAKPRDFGPEVVERLKRFAEISAYMLEARLGRLVAEEAIRAKNEFLANISHEFRTPMMAILGYAGMLRDGMAGGDCAAQASAIGSIERNGDQLLALINDVLELATLESQPVEVALVPVDANEIIDQTLPLLRGRADEKNLVLEREPGSARPVAADAARLRQVLLHIVGNAIKFTEQGRIAVRVRPCAGANGRPGCSIEVEDTGIGIASERMAALFDPFFQVESGSTRRFGGVGLGLAISRHMMNRMQGTISVRSTPGAGSTFSLWLPAAECGCRRSSSEPCRRSNAACCGKPGPVDLHGAPILLVEDGPDNQRLLRAFLERAGAEVTVVGDGVEAIEALTVDGRFDAPLQSPCPVRLIVMDIQMPRMDGCTAARELRRRGCAVPILALTAHALVHDREECLGAGCDEFATKPVRRESLVQRCASLISGLKSAV